MCDVYRDGLVLSAQPLRKSNATAEQAIALGYCLCADTNKLAEFEQDSSHLGASNSSYAK